MKNLVGVPIAALATVGTTVLLLENPLIGVGTGLLIALVILLRTAAYTARATAVVVLFAPATVAYTGSLEPPTVVMLATAALVAVGTLQRMTAKQREPYLPSGMLAIAALMVLASLLAGSSPASILIAARPYALVILLVWYFTREARLDPANFRTILLIVVWVAAAVSVLSLYQRAASVWPLLDDFATGVQYTARGYGGRPGGTLGHPILFGAMAALGAILCLSVRGRIWAVALVINGVGVLNSGSRSAYVALAVAVLCYAVAEGPSRIFRSGPVIAVTLLTSIAVPVTLIVPSFAVFFQDVWARLDISTDVSGQARNLRGELALSLILETPDTTLIGHGARSDVAYLTQFSIGDGQALTFDNTYLALWHNHGLLVLLPLVAGLAWAFVRGNSTSRALLAAFAAMLFFVDATTWPSLLAFGAIAQACRSSPSRSWRARGSEDSHSADVRVDGDHRDRLALHGESDVERALP